MTNHYKILFLDIDGVLNSDRYNRSLTVENFPYGMEIDPAATALLKNFLNSNPEVRIVISSSWRDTLSLEQFNEVFATYGIRDRIVDMTSSNMGKADSIELWVKTHKPSLFAILDDDILFSLFHRMHRLQIKTSMGIGLQKSHLEDLALLF